MSDFQSPFDELGPGELARQAAGALQARLREGFIAPGLSTSVLRGPEGGKMFGVLVACRPDGGREHLWAFSGMLAGRWEVEGFVPPLFDAKARAEVEPAGEVVVKSLIARAGELASSQALAEIRAEGEAQESRHRREREEVRERHRGNKALRHRRRAELRAGNAPLPELGALDQESRRDKAELRRLDALQAAERQALGAGRKRLERRVRALERLRRIVCRALMKRIHDTYRVPNFRNEHRSLRSLFAPREPPSGAGDCAAPKLLAHAAGLGLRPLALAEFWWGAPPPAGGRIEGAFYPACRDKCGPLLPHLLDGLAVTSPRSFSPAPIGEPLRVVYQDGSLVVVDKPAGLLSVPGRDPLVTDSVLARLRARHPHAEGPLLVHRLDLDTSGLLVAALDRRTHAELQRQFASREVDKRYLAWLDGAVRGDSGVVELALRVDLDDRPRQIHDPVHGKKAVTGWQVLNREQGRTRVALFPRTGRTHQLRAHAAGPRGAHRGRPPLRPPRRPPAAPRRVARVPPPGDGAEGVLRGGRAFLTRLAGARAIATDREANAAHVNLARLGRLLTGPAEDPTVDEVVRLAGPMGNDALVDARRLAALRESLARLPRAEVADQKQSAPGADATSGWGLRILAPGVTLRARLFQGLGQAGIDPSGEHIAWLLGSDVGLSPKTAAHLRFAKAELARADAHRDGGVDVMTAGLIALSRLGGPADPRAPPFMSRPAWRTRVANTQMGAWSEMEHDLSLYAKDTAYYLGMYERDERFHGYVEPVPAFFVELGALVARTRVVLVEAGAFAPMKASGALVSLEHFQTLEGLLASLERLAQKELAGTDFSSADIALLREFGNKLKWLALNESNLPHAREPMSVVTRVAREHSRNEGIWVGVGRPIRMEVAVPWKGKLHLARGGVYSYYEVRQPLSEPLDDARWKQSTAAPLGVQSRKPWLLHRGLGLKPPIWSRAQLESWLSQRSFARFFGMAFSRASPEDQLERTMKGLEETAGVTLAADAVPSAVKAFGEQRLEPETRVALYLMLRDAAGRKQAAIGAFRTVVPAVDSPRAGVVRQRKARPHCRRGAARAAPATPGERGAHQLRQPDRQAVGCRATVTGTETSLRSRSVPS
ncbi:MAG: RluA family pseudouridine synthase [Myxococcaceae bacterium]